ncbi:hypothetical protein Anapl_16294 [Anas platyrhynchos]|uniref:Uncharacterized protein n=1 Tax=Anas platyrhynchos TaxID=8839 RepID=R0JX06_ANAPL|nr:hypothetical protein Anapl_16294 [Anas platyrhynchos]
MVSLVPSLCMETGCGTNLTRTGGESLTAKEKGANRRQHRFPLQQQLLFMVVSGSLKLQGLSSVHWGLFQVRGKGWERSGRGNPSGLIREQSVNPVGAACRGHGTSPGSCTCLHHASSRLTWWPMRSRAVPGTDLDIPTTASAYATFTPPGYCRHHVHAVPILVLSELCDLFLAAVEALGAAQGEQLLAANAQVKALQEKDADGHEQKAPCKRSEGKLGLIVREEVVVPAAVSLVENEPDHPRSHMWRTGVLSVGNAVSSSKPWFLRACSPVHTQQSLIEAKKNLFRCHRKDAAAASQRIWKFQIFVEGMEGGADLWQLLLVEEQLIKEQQHHGVYRPTVVNTGLDANSSGLADQRGAVESDESSSMGAACCRTGPQSHSAMPPTSPAEMEGTCGLPDFIRLPYQNTARESCELQTARAMFPVSWLASDGSVITLSSIVLNLRRVEAPACRALVMSGRNSGNSTGSVLGLQRLIYAAMLTASYVHGLAKHPSRHGMRVGEISARASLVLSSPLITLGETPSFQKHRGALWRRYVSTNGCWGRSVLRGRCMLLSAAATVTSSRGAAATWVENVLCLVEGFSHRGSRTSRTPLRAD